MTVFAFIADGWGAVSGGINCFNYDLATACAHVKRDDKRTKICCVVPDLTCEQKAEMQRKGIIPITLSKAGFDSPEAAQMISNNMKADHDLGRYYPDKCNIFYVGHDIYTGDLSRRLAESCGGWNIVFHHMDYSSYYLLSKPSVPNYKEKVRRQKAIMGQADLICAVGPMLLQSAQDMARETNTSTVEVFPGLAEFGALKTPPNRFTPIVFGRVEKNNQAIKQIPLAIDAFAKAISADKDTPIFSHNPTLQVVGYETDDSGALTEEVHRLQKRSAEIAGGLCNVVPYPYTNNRMELGDLLRSASAAMMLSFHEGFGLVGYEAIAAGIPLILSKNTGLYMFLKQERLDHLVYPVQIEGSSSAEGYSQNDLDTVARALRDIRQEEDKYKKNALELREKLRSEEGRYSWAAVANNFIVNVLQEFEDELKSTSTVFYSPDEVTKLSADLNAGIYTDISFMPSSGKHVYVIKGKTALASLVASLQKKFDKKYDIFVYNMQVGEGGNSAYLDFLNNCRAAFGAEDDPDMPGFEYILGNRLRNTILILDEFPISSMPSFEELFSFLNKQRSHRNDFYIFAVCNSDSKLEILPFNKKNTPGTQDPAAKQKPILSNLTDEQTLLIKILAFRGKKGYSKRLIKCICSGMNAYLDERGQPLAFKNPAEIEKELKELGLIEEYSKYSYQNAEVYQAAVAALKLDDKRYALGLSRLGHFYARCYRLGRGRDQQLSWGYFSCTCFACAAALDDGIKSEIKADYEMLLSKMRKRAMDTSDYNRYLYALQKFIDEYNEPNDPWMWYTIIHCETICCPGMDTLNKLNRILQTEFPDAKQENRRGNALYMQFIRLVSELEYELDMDNSLGHLVDQVKALSEDHPSCTAWNQCLSTIVNLAVDLENFDLADEYLEQYRKGARPDDLYVKMITLAMETNLKLAKYLAGHEVDLAAILPNIGNANRIAKDILQDYRAQGWTTGLWGECQVLLNDKRGEGNLRKSMNFRKRSGEKTKTYRNWLHRISRYSLQPCTKELLEEEINRTGMQMRTGQGV